MKLGGMAATKFSAKNSYSHHSSDNSDNNSNTAANNNVRYNSSDRVRDFYLNEMKHTSAASSDDTVPDFWESRQKEREIQGKQMGVFAKDTRQQQQHQMIQQTPMQSTNNEEEAMTTRTSSPEPEVLLLSVATHALDALAKSLSKKNVAIPMDDRAAFANAVKEAMDALAKQS